MAFCAQAAEGCRQKNFPFLPSWFFVSYIDVGRINRRKTNLILYVQEAIKICNPKAFEQLRLVCHPELRNWDKRPGLQSVGQFTAR